jgi:DNA-binding MarR family transcriptional regulator
MKPRILRAQRVQLWFLPSAAAEVWEPVWCGHRLITRLGLLLETIEGVELTPIRCLVLAQIGRQSGLGAHLSLIARQLCIPRATLRYHVDVLRKARLITSIGPGPHDKRRQRLVLTPSGAETLNRAAELLVELTAGGEWPRDAPRRNHWNMRRLPKDSPVDGYVQDDPYPGASSWRPPPDRAGARRAPSR